MVWLLPIALVLLWAITLFLFVKPTLKLLKVLTEKVTLQIELMKPSPEDLSPTEACFQYRADLNERDEDGD